MKDTGYAIEYCRRDKFLGKYPLARHACDPFSPSAMLAEGVWCIAHPAPDGMGAANSFLVCGRERAALIDTGYGIGDLPALCRELTDRPVTVINTHFHPDHTGGNSRFGACVMHEKDAAMPDMLRTPQPITLLKRNPDSFYTASDVADPGRGEVTAVRDGDVIDLGGCGLEVIHLPGHTPGSIALLDRSRGALFTGDSLMTAPCSTLIVSFAGASKSPDCTVEAYLEGLIRLKARIGEIKTLYPGHCAPEAPPALINDAVACCEEILKSPGIGGGSRFRPGAKMHFHASAGVTYDMNRVRADVK